MSSILAALSAANLSEYAYSGNVVARMTKPAMTNEIVGAIPMEPRVEARSKQITVLNKALICSCRSM